MNFSEKRSDQIGLVLIIVLVILGLFLLVQTFGSDVESTYEPSITVTGEGRTFAVPDTASFNYTVRTEAASANEVARELAEVANDVNEALINSGVEEKDIKTESYNVYPRYEYGSRAGIGFPEGERRLVGYEATQTNQVRVRSIEEAPALLSIPTDNGADNVSQLDFSIWDETELEAEARQLAIDDAKQKAKALADQLGVSLGDITDYYENQEGGHYPMAFEARMEMSDDQAMGGITKIATGENEIKKVVNITFRIK